MVPHRDPPFIVAWPPLRLVPPHGRKGELSQFFPSLRLWGESPQLARLLSATVCRPRMWRRPTRVHDTSFAPTSGAGVCTVRS